MPSAGRRVHCPSHHPAELAGLAGRQLQPPKCFAVQTDGAETHHWSCQVRRWWLACPDQEQQQHRSRRRCRSSSCCDYSTAPAPARQLGLQHAVPGDHRLPSAGWLRPLLGSSARLSVSGRVSWSGQVLACGRFSRFGKGSLPGGVSCTAVADDPGTLAAQLPETLHHADCPGEPCR